MIKFNQGQFPFVPTISAFGLIHPSAHESQLFHVVFIHWQSLSTECRDSVTCLVRGLFVLLNLTLALALLRISLYDEKSQLPQIRIGCEISLNRDSEDSN